MHIYIICIYIYIYIYIPLLRRTPHVSALMHAAGVTRRCDVAAGARTRKEQQTNDKTSTTHRYHGDDGTVSEQKKHSSGEDPWVI